MFSFSYKLLFFYLAFCITSFSQQTKSNYMLWQANTPLTWNDFKGKPERRFAAASTSYDILKNISKNNTKATVTIKAVFFYYSSWKKKQWVNESVLAHEQKHFDIVELYARKLRKLIIETKYKNFDDLENKVDELYATIDKEMDVYQDLYDEESDGSMNGDKQREWNKKITNEINALDAYKNTLVEVKW